MTQLSALAKESSFPRPFQGCSPPGMTSRLPSPAFQEPFIGNNRLKGSRTAVTTRRGGARVAPGAAPGVPASSAHSRPGNAGCGSVSHVKAGGEFPVDTVCYT